MDRCRGIHSAPFRSNAESRREAKGTKDGTLQTQAGGEIGIFHYFLEHLLTRFDTLLIFWWQAREHQGSTSWLDVLIRRGSIVETP